MQFKHVKIWKTETKKILSPSEKLIKFFTLVYGPLEEKNLLTELNSWIPNYQTIKEKYRYNYKNTIYY